MNKPKCFCFCLKQAGLFLFRELHISLLLCPPRVRRLCLTQEQSSVAAGTRGGAGTLTCTFHSLSNEAPHEVGTVFTPVWPSERMDLKKEWGKVEKGKTWGGCCASIKGGLHKLAELKMWHAHLENPSSGTDKWRVFRTSFLLLEGMTHHIDRLQFPSGNNFYHGIFQWVVSSGTGSPLTLTCKSECEDSKAKKQGWQRLESVKILSVQFPGQNGLRILKWPWLKLNHQTGPILQNILYYCVNNKCMLVPIKTTVNEKPKAGIPGLWHCVGSHRLSCIQKVSILTLVKNITRTEMPWIWTFN